VSDVTPRKLALTIPCRIVPMTVVYKDGSMHVGGTIPHPVPRHDGHDWLKQITDLFSNPASEIAYLIPVPVSYDPAYQTLRRKESMI